MHIYEACPEVENESFLLYIPHINDRLPGRARSQAVTNLMCVRSCPDPLGDVLWCAVGRGTRQGLPLLKGAFGRSRATATNKDKRSFTAKTSPGGSGK